MDFHGALFLHQFRCSRQTVCQAGGHSDGKLGGEGPAEAERSRPVAAN